MLSSLRITPKRPIWYTDSMIGPQIVGFVFLIIGGFYALRPDIVMRFQIWTQRVILGAEYKPSTRTYTIMRGVGVVFVVIGLLVFAKVIE
jgi:hypothetical protein